MSTATAEPAFVARQRADKADRLAAYLQSTGVTPAQSARLGDAERRAAEIAAGIRRGSDSTWRLAIEMLAGSAMPSAVCRTCGLGDPQGVAGPPKPHGHEGPCAH